MRIASGFNFGGSAPPNIVTNGLVLWLDAGNLNSYSGSGVTWGDMSGSGNSPTLANSPTYSTDNGGILDFDGVDEYADLGSPSPANLNNEYATHEVWVKMDTPNSGTNQQIIARRNVNDGTFTMLKAANNFLQFITRNSDNTRLIMTLNSVLSTNWTHLVHTYDGTTVSGYVNGTLDNSSTAISGPLNTSGTFYMQIARNSNNINYFNGKLGVVRAYNRSLSAAEILQNYNAQRGRFGV